MSVHNLTGDWNGAFIEQVGSDVRIVPDWSVINPATAPWTLGTGTLTGSSLTVGFTGGQAPGTVTYFGSVSPDGGRISWSNGTHWYKRP